MEEIKVGEYVRTNYGEIAKITQTFPQIKGIKKVNPSLIDFNLIVKHSFNIIDLIECGDYVNGELVVDKLQTPCRIGKEGKKFIFTKHMNVGEGYFEEDIKSIVTKEQFKHVEYRLEE